MDKFSYSMGLAIGRNLKDMGIEYINSESFTQGMQDMMSGKTPEVEPEEANHLIQQFMAEAEAKKKMVDEKKGALNRQQGETFLANNLKEEGVISLPSGLQYKVLREGTGKSPKSTDQVRCHYRGTLIDGTVFDSSYHRDEPATFPLNGVIKGWTEGLQLMKEGAQYRFFIPYHMAYGSTGAGAAIPPYAALIFDVELIKVL